MDINKLRQQTKEAIAKGKEKLAQEEVTRSAAEAEKNKKELLKAEKILSSLQAKCEAAAAKGANGLLVAYEERSGYYTTFFIGGQWHVNFTKGFGSILVDRLKNMGFTVKCLENYNDAMSCWAEIYIYW